MMASISLAHKQVLFKDGAAISVARFASSGPFDIFLPLYRATKARRGRASSGFLIVAVLTLLSIVLQFSSTILTNDLAMQKIPDNYKTKNVTYQRSQDRVGSVYGWRLLARNPTEYPVFAEQTASFNSITVTGEGGLGDTGNTLRAFLPLSKTNRTRLISYEGPANIIASHVLCFSPSIQSFNATFIVNGNDTVGTKDNSIHIDGVLNTPILARNSGKLPFPDSFEGLRNFTALRFGCNIPFRKVEPTSSSQSIFYALCDFTPFVLNRYNEDPDKSFPPKNIMSNFTNWILVTNTLAGTDADWKNASFVGIHKPVYDESEWTTLSDVTRTVSVGLSLCVHTFRRTQNKMISAHGEWNRTEPEVVDNYFEFYEQPFNTEPIRLMHGVLNNGSFTTSQRGILSLTQTHDILGDFSHEVHHDLRSLMFEDNSPSISMCNSCDDRIRVSHPILSRLFIDTVSDSGRPSKALQVLLTTMASMYYYDRMLFFNVGKEAKIQYVTNLLIPQRNLGLSVVTGMIAFHFALMLLITWLYLPHRHNSHVGQVWMSVAQLHIGDAGKFLDQVSTLDDDAVNDLLLKDPELEGLSDGLAKISSIDSGTKAAIKLTPIPRGGLR
ncbi:hypothetical protein K440DRAFT_663957 [Wilcoxina mikolae CBS 423.85]|nr:hypothetical protein K440DRAFT_663957 [Wilcoxina mikolae CBS 423.85]